MITGIQFDFTSAELAKHLDTQISLLEERAKKAAKAKLPKDRRVADKVEELRLFRSHIVPDETYRLLVEDLYRLRYLRSAATP